MHGLFHPCRACGYFFTFFNGIHRQEMTPQEQARERHRQERENKERERND